MVHAKQQQRSSNLPLNGRPAQWEATRHCAIHSFCCRNRPCEHDTVHGFWHNRRNIDTNNTRHKRTEYGHQQHVVCASRGCHGSHNHQGPGFLSQRRGQPRERRRRMRRQPRDQGWSREARHVTISSTVRRARRHDIVPIQVQRDASDIFSSPRP